MTKYLTQPGYLAVVLAALLAFSLPACGGDDDGGDNSTAETPTSEANGDGGNDDGESGDDDGSEDDPTATPDEGSGDSSDDGSTDDDSTDDGGDSEEDPLEDLRDAAEQSGPERFKFVYDVTVDEESFTLTFARDGDRTMYGIDGTFEGQDSNLTLINDTETTYVCTEEGGSGGTCFEQPGTDTTDFFGGAFTFDREDLLNEVTEQGADVTPAGSRTVAGREAECYDFSSPDGDGTICIDSEESFIVYTEGEFDGMSQTMELVESSDPTDEDFEPPFESMCSIGG